jgi:alkylhydroperoxidase family enzyme
MSGHARAGTPGTSTGNVIRDSSLGLVPDTLDSLIALQSQIWNGSSLKPALLEMLRLRNARTVNCVFCKSVRYDVARQDGLTEAKIEQIDDDFRNSSLPDAEKLLLAFADVYLLDPQSVDPRLISQLREHYSEEQLCHAAIALGTFHAMSRCAVALGGMPEALPIIEMSPPST